MKEKPQMMMIPTDRNNIPILLNSRHFENDRFYYYSNIQLKMIDYAVYSQEHPAAENSFRVEKRPAHCVYVNSQSCKGDSAEKIVYKDFTAYGPVETGDGSKENPFINLNSVMWEITSDSGRLNCLGKNCIRICIIVSGIVDYYVVNPHDIYTRIDDLVFNFKNADIRLIREEEIEVSGEGSPEVSAIKYVNYYHPFDFYLQTNIQIQYLKLTQTDELQSELVKEGKYGAMVPYDLSVRYHNLTGGSIGLRNVYWNCNFSLDYKATTDQSSEYIESMATYCNVVVFDTNANYGSYCYLLGCTVNVNSNLDIKALHRWTDLNSGTLLVSYYDGYASFRCEFFDSAKTTVIADCKIKIASTLSAQSGCTYCNEAEAPDCGNTWYENQSSTYFSVALLGGAAANIIGSEISVECSADAGKGAEESIFEQDGTITKTNSSITEDFKHKKDRD